MFKISTDANKIGRCVFINDYTELANFIADEVIIENSNTKLSVHGENIVDLILNFHYVLIKIKETKRYLISMLQSDQIIDFSIMNDGKTIKIKDDVSSAQGDIDSFRQAVYGISKSVVSFIRSKYNIDLEYLFDKK